MDNIVEINYENIKELMDAPPEFMFGRRDPSELTYDVVSKYKFFPSNAASVLLGVTKEELRSACFRLLKPASEIKKKPIKGPEGLKLLKNLTDDDFRALQNLNVREAAKKIGIGMNTLKRYSRMRGIDGWARKVEIANYKARDFLPYKKYKPVEAAKIIGCSRQTYIKYHNLVCKNKI